MNPNARCGLKWVSLTELVLGGGASRSAEVSAVASARDRATLDDRTTHPVLVEEVTSTGQVWVRGSALECCHPLVDRFLPQGNRFVGEARDERVVAEIGEHDRDPVRRQPLHEWGPKLGDDPVF